MCTAVSWKCGSHYFGRTLDLEYSYAEAVTVTPRNCSLPFRRMGTMAAHYAIIGIAAEADGYPLYYDGMNERGLCMAALRFPDSAPWPSEEAGRDNLAPFELIPWILGQCASVRQARPLLARLHLADIPFSEQFPLTPLHWILADGAEALVIEQTAAGTEVYENPLGVLTNNPAFPQQLRRAQAFAGGLPGNLSSPARFVRAMHTAQHAACPEESERAGQFFHIMDTVANVRGCKCTAEGALTETVYTSCYDTAAGCCLYTTYGNRRITGVNLRAQEQDGRALIRFPLRSTEDILREKI